MIHHSRLRSSNRGFTLIELLIVIAIILILIAIALPNFLAARTRGSVTKLMSEMRMVASSMNHYFSDFNIYPNPYYPFRMAPPQGNPPGSSAMHRESFLWIVASGNVTRWDPERQVGRQLTTPIKYLSDIPADPFWSQTFQKTLQGDDGITYGDFNNLKISSCSSLYYSPGHNRLNWGTNLPDGWMDGVNDHFEADFMLHSTGPNLRIEQGSVQRHAFYDPSNGVRSDGDIYFVGAEYGFLGNGHMARPPVFIP